MKSKEITYKQQEFNKAMWKFHNNKAYQLTYKVVSYLNVSLQVILFYILFTLVIPLPWIIFIFLVAYFITDFINGLVHLYMDNNDSYNSFFGPFIASFHLHHKTIEYKKSNIFSIYFNESGTKFWLVIYLLFVIFLSFMQINHILLSVLILVGILSSVAEVSHYLCHNSNSKVVKLLQILGLLLRKSKHKKHHKYDNVQYAFLNGMSDILIDKIAKKLYMGYKENSDKHYETYVGKDTTNRT